MAIATYDSERFTLTDTGFMVVLRSKLSPSVAMAFSDWDVVKDVASVILRALPPEMRNELLAAFEARADGRRIGG